MYRRRAAEAERRHFVIEASAARWSRRGSRLLAGGLIVIWFSGSILVAYWLGEPYLRRHRNDVDPVEARLMAEALSRKEKNAAMAVAKGATSTPVDSHGGRIEALERRIADAVLRIDKLRSDAVSAAYDREIQAELRRLRDDVATSNREISALRENLSALRKQQAAVRVAAVVPRVEPAAPSNPPPSIESDGIIAETRATRNWAMGAVSLSLAASFLTLVMFIRQRRRPKLPSMSAVEEQFLSSVWPEADAEPALPDREPIESPRQLRVASPPNATMDEATHDASEVRRRMIAEMREASIAGVERPVEEPDRELPSLILVEDEDAISTHPDKIDVVAENRLGVDFAVRISDGERAGLAGRRVGADDSRSVA